MKFDIDLEKSIINKIRHGIDFIEAQSLWGRPVIEVRLRGDTRKAVIGILDEKYWAALIEHDDGYVLPLSVRPAREEEISLYEENAFQ